MQKLQTFRKSWEVLKILRHSSKNRYKARLSSNNHGINMALVKISVKSTRISSKYRKKVGFSSNNPGINMSFFKISIKRTRFSSKYREKSGDQFKGL